MKKQLHTLKNIAAAWLLAMNFSLIAQTYKVDTLQYKGDINKYVNVVILGDGYTTAELTKLQNDAKAYINNFMFSQTPFKEYKNYFNVFLIEVPSPESGIKHPRTASDCPAASTFPAANPNNFYGTSFDISGIHRLVTPNSTKVSNVLAANFPNYDQAYIIANTDQYGGAGGQFATFTTNASSGEIGLHEGGHSFAGLADEYWAGAQYAKEKPNMTQQTSSTLVKWKNWMNVNGVGIYPHTGDASWKKPRTGECKMELLGKPFCSVCTETIVEKIHALVRPVYQQAPLQASVTINAQTVDFSVSYMLPIANTMSIRWILDGFATTKNQVSVINWSTSGKLLAQNKDAISLNSSLITPGTHKLKMYIIDTTALTRNELHPGDHLDSIVWTLSATATGLEQVQQENAISIHVFPNPVTADLMVSYKLEKEQAVIINLISMDGKRLRTYENRAAVKGEHVERMNIQDFSPGAYFVEIRSDEFSFIQQIIKQ